MLSTGQNAAAQGSAPLAVVEATGEDAVVVPMAGFLQSARYLHSGPDLLLVGQGGQTVVVRDYFNQTHPPGLTDGHGAAVPADLVAGLVGSRAPGQLAQAGPGPTLNDLNTLAGATPGDGGPGGPDIPSAGGPGPRSLSDDSLDTPGAPSPDDGTPPAPNDLTDLGLGAVGAGDLPGTDPEATGGPRETFSVDLAGLGTTAGLGVSAGGFGANALFGSSGQDAITSDLSDVGDVNALTNPSELNAVKSIDKVDETKEEHDLVRGGDLGGGRGVDDQGRGIEKDIIDVIDKIEIDDPIITGHNFGTSGGGLPQTESTSGSDDGTYGSETEPDNILVSAYTLIFNGVNIADPAVYNYGGSNDQFITVSGGGDATVNAGNGVDVIMGGSGDETINAGGGNDTIYTGLGTDTVTGGSGNDVFQFREADIGPVGDVITDFSPGGSNDVIDYNGFGYANAAIRGIGIYSGQTADTASELAAIVNSLNGYSPASFDVALFVADNSNGTDTTVWRWSDDASTGGNDDGHVDAAEIEPLATLQGVTGDQLTSDDFI